MQVWETAFVLKKDWIIDMDNILIRVAAGADLDELYKFEQGVISTERPFDATLGDNIHYYDLKHMLTASHIRLLVAEANNKIVGSG